MRILHYFIIGLILFAFACSPQQRFQKLLQRYPELAQATVTDSAILPAYSTDTVLLLRTDTAYFTQHIQGALLPCPDSVATVVKKIISRVPASIAPMQVNKVLHLSSANYQLQVPVTVDVEPIQGANAWRISVQSAGAKIISSSKAVQTTGITREQIKKYRQQGMKILAGWIGAALLLALILYAMYRVYTSRFGAGAEWAKNLINKQ